MSFPDPNQLPTVSRGNYNFRDRREVIDRIGEDGIVSRLDSDLERGTMERLESEQVGLCAAGYELPGQPVNPTRPEDSGLECCTVGFPDLCV
jgi:hypothetical protein